MGRAANAIHSRQGQRYPTSIAATVIVDRQDYSAEIKDVSSQGCCVSGTFGLAKGDEIVIVVGGLSVVATVAWSKGMLAGANFHRQIDPLQVVRDYSDHPIFTRRRLANAMAMHAG